MGGIGFDADGCRTQGAGEIVRGWLGSALVFCLVLLAGPAARAEPTDPASVLAGVTDRLVQEASRHGQEYRREPDRARALAGELLAPLVDFTGIGRRVLGAHGRRATAEQLDRFAAEYREFVVNTLASGFVEQVERVARYGQGVRFLPTRWGEGQRTAAVRGRVTLEGGVPLEVDFRVREVGGAWKIYDVLVAGVSLVQANQAAFARELESAGVEGLTARLSTHNRTVAPGEAGPRACCG